MRYHLIIKSKAEKDLQQSFEWYQEKKQGLGDELIEQTEVTIRKILDNPYQYPRIHGEIRRALVRRFPYSILYIVEKDTVSIIAIFHCKRNPSEWEGSV